MKFYVIWSDGRKFGPADVATLNQWIKEGRVTRDTVLENADTAQKQPARDVAGLAFPTSTTDLGGNDPMIRPTAQPGTGQANPYTPGQPYVAGRPEDPLAGGGPSPYQHPPQPGSPYPRGQAQAQFDDGSQKMVNNAWILIVIGLVCCGCFVTPFGIYQAHRAKNMSNPNANAPFIVGWILLVLQVVGSIIYGAIVYSGMSI